MLPYSKEVYFSLFAELNERFLWLQILAALFAALVAFELLFARALKLRMLLGALALLWACSSYFWYFEIFAGLNFLAPVYGGVAGLYAAGWVLCGVLPGVTASDAGKLQALPLVLLGLLWPVFDVLSGEGWPALRLLGLHPVPLIFLSLAVCVRVGGRVRVVLLAVPLLLSGVSAYEAFALGLPQDWLPLAGCGYAVAAGCAWRRRKA